MTGDAFDETDLDGGFDGEFDEADFADRPLPPRVSRTSRVAILAAIAAVIAMVAAGLVIGGGEARVGTEGDDSVVTSAAPTTIPAAINVDVTSTLADDAAAVSTTTAAGTTTVTTTVASPPTTAITAQAVLAIPDDCLAELPVCVQLVSAPDGRIVALSPVDNTLTVLAGTGQEVLDVIDLSDGAAVSGPWLVAVGPDDVAYLGVSGAGDAQLDLWAVPLSGPDRGEASLVAEGLDGSGDSDLVPTIDGLASVGCCGFDLVRPGPDSSVVPWLNAARADTATFQIELGDGGNNLVRLGPTRGVTSWTLPTAATSLRGMPPVVPTDDGGALMWVFHQPIGTSHLVRFDSSWPQYRTDNTQVFHLGDGFEHADIRLLEPAGTVIVAEDGALVRRALDEVGSPGWVPDFEFDFETWTVDATGLNDHIAAEQPSWAVDAAGLSFQLAPEIGPAERFNAQFDPATNELSIEVSNFLDDSVVASRTVWPLTIDVDGLYRVGTASRSQQCQPGRGHQDFQPEPCI